MEQYVHRPTLVDAEQWNGQDIEGLNVRRPEIIRSLDNSLYYITGCMCKDWLGIEPGKDGKYKTLPFAFYEVKSNPVHEAADVDHPLVVRYMEAFGFGKLENYAWLELPGGSVKLQEGDYLLKDKEGKYSICREADFKKWYSKVN